jgi:hypothetical protein
MYVRITKSTAAELVDPEVLDQLSVQMIGEAPRDLGGFGSFDGDHAWLGVQALRTAAHNIGVGADWDDRFDGMLAYAKSRGWLSSSGSALRAHIERQP